MPFDKSSNVSLQVSIEGKVIFESDGKWLHPLFDLKEFLDSEEFSLDNAEICDKVIGKAAALIFVYLGARHVHGSVMSDLAIQVFTNAEIDYSYDQRVDRIACKTEALLFNINDPGEAYQFICIMAKRC